MNAPVPVPVAPTAPTLQSFVQPAVGSFPSVPVAAATAVGPFPSVPVAAATSVGPPAIDVIHDSDSDPDVQSLTIPFRSASSELFLPMISTDDAWVNNVELRYIVLLY